MDGIHGKMTMKNTKNRVEAIKIYRQLNRKKYFIPCGLAIICVITLIIDVMTGPAMLPAREVIGCILRPGKAESTIRVIVLQMRLPIALMALVIGCSLGASGAVMQTILHNPLASPYTLGVGAGAAFGASLAIVMGLGTAGTSINAFVFSMLVCLLLYLLGKKGNFSTNSMVLSGIALLFLFQSLQAFIQYGSSETQNQAIVFWSFGSFQRTTWAKFALTGIITVVCVPLLLKDSWNYTALLMGDEKAESLGIRVNRVKLRAFFIISLLSAVAVCFTGTIGFIGLAAPHIARICVGEEQRFYIITSSVCGMLLLSVASILSKLIIPGIVYPIGIITSIIGVPFFFILVLKRKGGGEF